MQDKIKQELSGQPSTRMFGMFSIFHLLGPNGRWGACIVLSAALLLTFTAWHFVRGEVIKRAQTRFNFRVKTIETGISERLQAYEFLLQGGSGLFSISNEVTRKDWRTYINRLQIDQYYPGLQGVGFSKRILPSEKEAHIRHIRGEGFPQYTIYPDGERPEYTSIIFLEPFDWRNQRAFGYDMFSQATRKEAMIRARDTGKAALSGKVTLVQEMDKDMQSGFLIYQAIYRKGEPQETPKQRRKAILGYVYSPFRMNDFMKGILAEKRACVDLQIFDGDKPLKETLLYQSNNAEELHNHPKGRHFALNQIILESAGHSWMLSFVSSKYFEENISSGVSNFILVLGITISLLLFGMVLSLSKSRSQAIALANTTVDLEKVEMQLQQAQKMEAIGRLAGGVAHDYNNISTIIIGYSEFALKNTKQGDPLHEDLLAILNAAKRSTDITRQLLAFARKQIIAPKVLDLNNIVGNILKMIQRLIGEDIDIQWVPGAEVWLVKVDPSQVDQVVVNLAVNARDAIANVGKVTIETKNISFDEDYCADHTGFISGEYLLLAISDDGCGIEPDILDKIFEPFFTTKEVGKGTGLGLSTVYGIVKQNNGFINVYSEPEKGTTIKIYLPRHEGQTAEVHSDNDMEIPKSHGETVLLVEDDGSILNLGKRILEDLGYIVLSANRPSEATKLIEEQAIEINLLITDVVMPEMNGRELSKHLKSLCPNLKVLFMSGYTANVIAHRGVLDDDINFLSKPFSKKDMAIKVREVLDEAKIST